MIHILCTTTPHSMHTWPSPAKLTEYHHPACSWLQDQDQNTQGVQTIMLILIRQHKTMHIFSAVTFFKWQTHNSLANVLHWHVTYSVCVCVHAHARRCVYVHVHTGVWIWVWVLFRWCRWVYISNYARWCMSVLLFAYVCMLTAFETLSLL